MANKAGANAKRLSNFINTISEETKVSQVFCGFFCYARVKHKPTVNSACMLEFLRGNRELIGEFIKKIAHKGFIVLPGKIKGRRSPLIVYPFLDTEYEDTDGGSGPYVGCLTLEEDGDWGFPIARKTDIEAGYPARWGKGGLIPANNNRRELHAAP